MKRLYVKLHETSCLYFPFLFSLSVMQSFFSFPVLSLFGTQQQLTHPPVKSLTFPLRKIPVFQGVAPRHTFFTSSCVIPLWDSATIHSPYIWPTFNKLNNNPPVKSSTLPLRKMSVFRGVALRNTIFPSSCVIPLWDSATAHSPADKELKLSSLEESCFLGLIVCQRSHSILHRLSLVCYSTILIIKSICQFILSVVYFYSEWPGLSIIFYSMRGLFL